MLSVGLYTMAASAAPRPAWPPWPEATLASYRFNDLVWHPPLLPPAIGFENAYVAESWSEYALIRDGLSIAPVAVPTIDSTGRKTFAADSGSVRFWFRPDWSSTQLGGKGPGNYARLLELVDMSGSKASVRWSLYVGDGGDTVYFSGTGANTRARDFLAASVGFVAGEWQLITLNYGPKGSQLWIGDEQVVEGAGVPAPTQWQVPSLGLIIGSDLAVLDPANGQFEELTTFDYWPDAKQLQFYYGGVSRQVFLGTVGSVEEEAVKQELLAAAYPQLKKFEEEGGDVLKAYSYSTNEFWLEITGASNGVAHLILHTTEPWTTYEILSKDAPTNASWLSETNVLGAEGQDWTPADVLMGDRTNALFFRARSYVDDDGDGLPDWWELEHGLDPTTPDTGNTGVSDGYKDGDNDGWNNLQEYRNGTNPGSFNTPPAPQGVNVHINAAGDEVTVTWIEPSPAVANYVVERDWYYIVDQFTNSTTTLLDDEIFLPSEPYRDYKTPSYRVRAVYPSGYSAWSGSHYPAETINPVEARLLTGAGQTGLLLAANIPGDAAAIRLSGKYYVSGQGLVNTNFDLGTGTFQSGTAPLPDFVQTNEQVSAWSEQVVRTNGFVSMLQPVQDSDTGARPFVDGREALLENLAFWLRAACTTDKFELHDDALYNYYPFPDHFIYASFVNAYDYLSEPQADAEPWLPYEDNYRYRNCVYDTGQLHANDGWLNTGFYYNQFFDMFALAESRSYEFTQYTYGSFPTLLPAVDVQWQNPGWSQNVLGIDIAVPGAPVEMASNVFNYYGLRFLSAQVVWAGGTNGLITTVLSAGSAVTNLDPSAAYIQFYPETAQPEFENAGYYFGQMNVHPLPGHNDFAETATTPLLVASVGEPIQIAGYAKLAIANGYTNKFAYLGQYFDKAYKADTNGMATTNETGFLSPYGEFIPTEPGRVVLTTMPDGVSTNVGECTVHVVGLNVDANHDGVMDLSLTGPDQTSQNHPMVFWANNNYDVPGTGGNPDKTIWLPPNATGTDYSFGQIRTMRNLEDFSRLWICGMPTLPASQGYSVQIGWSQVESGTPKLRLYRATETNGGIGYLTNITTASQQILDYNFPIGEVTPTSSLTLPTSWFTNGLNRYFLFEAGGIGKGALTLTISQGTNVIAQTSAWMDFHDIRDFYEEVAVTSVIQTWPEMVQTNLNSDFKVVRPSTAGIGDAKQMAVFVHGWRMPYSDFEIFSQTMFKRLYWQGYQGKFAAVRWPTRSSDTDPDGLDYATYNRSEYISFQSATGTALYLYDLRDRLSDYTISVCSHSQGGILMMEALAELAASSESPLDHYVMMETAVPAHCYDPAVTNLPALVNMEQSIPTPNTYLNYASTITNALRGGKVINFFNPVDFALASGLGGTGLGSWENNQELLKPLVFFGYLYIATNQTAYVISNQFTGAFGITNLQNRIVTDPLELMPFVARPRSKAVGAQAGVGNVVNGPEYNLQSQLGFTAATYDHSGQFNRNIQTPQVQGFYFNLLRALTEGEL